ncbi:MAG: Hpt domain-containing protein [bacterium]|nr:Hpt domain-containing protein [bacterium]
MTPLIDPAQLETLRRLAPDDGGEFFTRVIDIFLKQLHTIPAEIRRAYERTDGETVVRLAHTLKGSAGNLGASPLVDLCLRIEESAGDGDADLEELIGGLDELAALTSRELETIKAEAL